VVPYRENPLCKEHVNYYDEDYYLALGRYSWKVFPKIPARFEAGFIFEYYLKNFVRILVGRKWLRRPDVILFHFSSASTLGQHVPPRR
jgi:hypothetical protein